MAQRQKEYDNLRDELKEVYEDARAPFEPLGACLEGRTRRLIALQRDQKHEDAKNFGCLGRQLKDLQ